MKTIDGLDEIDMQLESVPTHYTQTVLGLNLSPRKNRTMNEPF